MGQKLNIRALSKLTKKNTGFSALIIDDQSIDSDGTIDSLEVMICVNCNFGEYHMFQRLLTLRLENQDSVFIFVPRGTGKTAWLKKHLKDQEYLYIDLLGSATFRTLFAKPEKINELIKPNFSGWINYVSQFFKKRKKYYFISPNVPVGDVIASIA